MITDSLIPANQISTDDFAGSLANQTNLAIKGIVGIRAMAEIAKLNGDDAKAANYSVRSSLDCVRLLKLRKTKTAQSIAAEYVQKWQKLAVSADGSHLTLSVRVRSSYSYTDFRVRSS